MACWAFSMSFLISGVMLKSSFWGVAKGIMGEGVVSGFLLKDESHEMKN